MSDEENTMQRVLRWDVPVDDQWHEIGAGRVVEVDARGHRRPPGYLVEVWTIETTADDGIDVSAIRKRPAIAVGTGHPVPENAEHIGTAIVPTFLVHQTGQNRHPLVIESTVGLVWHVFGRNR